MREEIWFKGVLVESEEELDRIKQREADDEILLRQARLSIYGTTEPMSPTGSPRRSSDRSIDNRSTSEPQLGAETTSSREYDRVILEDWTQGDTLRTQKREFQQQQQQQQEAADPIGRLVARHDASSPLRASIKYVAMSPSELEPGSPRSRQSSVSLRPGNTTREEEDAPDTCSTNTDPIGTLIGKHRAESLESYGTIPPTGVGGVAETGLDPPPGTGTGFDLLEIERVLDCSKAAIGVQGQSQGSHQACSSRQARQEGPTEFGGGTREARSSSMIHLQQSGAAAADHATRMSKRRGSASGGYPPPQASSTASSPSSTAASRLSRRVDHNGDTTTTTTTTTTVLGTEDAASPHFEMIRREEASKLDDLVKHRLAGSDPTGRRVESARLRREESSAHYVDLERAREEAAWRRASRVQDSRDRMPPSRPMAAGLSGTWTGSSPAGGPPYPPRGGLIQLPRRTAQRALASLLVASPEGGGTRSALEGLSPPPTGGAGTSPLPHRDGEREGEREGDARVEIPALWELPATPLASNRSASRDVFQCRATLVQHQRVSPEDGGFSPSAVHYSRQLMDDFHSTVSPLRRRPQPEPAFSPAARGDPVTKLVACRGERDAERESRRHEAERGWEESHRLLLLRRESLDRQLDEERASLARDRLERERDREARRRLISREWDLEEEKGTPTSAGLPRPCNGYLPAHLPTHLPPSLPP